MQVSRKLRKFIQFSKIKKIIYVIYSVEIEISRYVRLVLLATGESFQCSQCEIKTISEDQFHVTNFLEISDKIRQITAVISSTDFSQKIFHVILKVSCQ